MKNRLLGLISGLTVSFLGLLTIITSYFAVSILLFFIGIFFLVLGILLVILIQSLNIFLMDKELNVEMLKKSGLTIVECPKCCKQNVLQDIFCVHCGERLGIDDEIQEKHIT